MPSLPVLSPQPKSNTHTDIPNPAQSPPPSIPFSPFYPLSQPISISNSNPNTSPNIPIQQSEHFAKLPNSPLNEIGSQPNQPNPKTSMSQKSHTLSCHTHTQTECTTDAHHTSHEARKKQTHQISSNGDARNRISPIASQKPRKVSEKLRNVRAASSQTTLLHISKQTSPGISNPRRSLSKCFPFPNHPNSFSLKAPKSPFTN